MLNSLFILKIIAMELKLLRMLFCGILFLLMLTTQAQPLPCQTPNSERHNSSPYGGVTNPFNAIDGSATTYSTLHTISGTIYQDLKFPSGALAGDTIKIKLSFAVPILNTSMIANIEVGSYMGTTPNNDYKNLSSSSVSLQWSGSTEVLVSFAPSVNFDWAEVRITSLFSYQVSEVRIHYAYKPSVPPLVTRSSIKICPGQRATLSVTGEPGSVFKWYTQPTGGINIHTGTSYITPPLYASKTYYVTAELHGCPSKRTAVTVIVSPSGISKQWDKTYGGSGYDFIRSLLRTSDNGFLLGATSNSSDGDVTLNEGNDFWVVKTDSNGKKIWDKVYGGHQYVELADMVSTPDGGYILAGLKAFDGPPIINRGNIDLWIVKIDGSGNQIWDTTYGGSNGEEPFSIVPAVDGAGYVIAAYTTSNSGDITDGNNGLEDVWVLKIDENGNKLWDKTFGGSNSDFPADMIQTLDGNYMFSGFTYSSDGDVTDGNNGLADIWVVKLDPSGHKLWDKTFGGSGGELGYQLLQRSETKIVVVGYTESSNGDITDGNNGGWDGLFFIFDNDGNKLLDKTYGGSQNENIYTVNLASAGYVLNGITSSSDGDVTDGNNGNGDVWILRVDSSGSKLSDKTYGSSKGEWCVASLTLDNGNYLFGGQTYGNNGDVTDGNNGITDAWIIKVSLICEEDHSVAKLSSITEVSSNEGLVKFYPNPFTSELNISLDASITGNARVELLDFSGNSVAVFNVMAPQIALLTRNLEQGIYICKIYVNEEVYVRKVVKFE